MVVTSQPLAAQAGLAMLAQGGNAVDAALATAIALTVLEPTGNGLGSDAFAILWDGQELHGLNASGAAPAAWNAQRFAGRVEMPFRGWESVTVPGAVSAWVALSKRFGALPFADLFVPAIRYAEDGFAVSPVIAALATLLRRGAELWARAAEQLGDQPGFAETFLPDGRAPRAGERFRAPGHARTLRAIAQTHGRDFYEGEIAEAIAAFAKKHDAALSLADMASHRPEWCGTISTAFDDATLHEIPPNGQGIAALMGLGILSHTPIREMAVLLENVPAARLFDEMLKLLFSGYAVKCLTQLREEGLHHGLLPLLDVILEQPMGERFVWLSLENTDERVRQDKSVSPGFLFATLLWHEVLKAWEVRKSAGVANQPALFEAMDEVLDTQARKLAITRRIVGDIKDIWALQPRFDKRAGKTPYRLIEQPRYRAGWDFLRLRAQSGEIPMEIPDWWNNFAHAGHDQRENLLRAAPQTADAPAKKRRRKRRKPAAADGEAAMADSSAE